MLLCELLVILGVGVVHLEGRGDGRVLGDVGVGVRWQDVCHLSDHDVVRDNEGRRFTTPAQPPNKGIYSHAETYGHVDTALVLFGRGGSH